MANNENGKAGMTYTLQLLLKAKLINKQFQEVQEFAGGDSTPTKPKETWQENALFHFNSPSSS
jgi:hypothetical protein